MDMSWAQGQGWVGVTIGLAMFGLGWFKGRESADKVIESVIAYTIDDLIARGYLRTRVIRNKDTGEDEQYIVKADEE